MKVLPILASFLLCSCQIAYQGHVDRIGPRHFQENQVSKKTKSIIISFQGNALAKNSQQELSHAVTQEPSPHRTSIHIVVAREIDEAKLATLKKFLKTKGLRFNQIHTSTDLMKLDKNSFEAKVDHFEVMPPNCPDWRQTIAFEDSTKPPSNYGCAAAWNAYYSAEDPAMLFGGYAALSESRKVDE